MRASATVLIRSLLGVSLFKKNPHAATQPPAKKALDAIATDQKAEGGKKNTQVTRKQYTIAPSIRLFADFMLFIKNLQKNSPAKVVTMAPRIITSGDIP